MMSMEKVQEKVQNLINKNEIIVFSKTTCPHCHKLKHELTAAHYTFKAVELDQENDGADMLSALERLSAQRTVPNVFVSGTHCGGCTETLNMMKNGDFALLVGGEMARKIG